MEDSKTHNTKYNFDDLFLRSLLIGLSKFINGKLQITYNSKEQGEYTHVIPLYFTMGADAQYLIDAFYDDIPDTRVHTNTDITPRGVIKFDTWRIAEDKFTNPNVWYDVPTIIEDELVLEHKQISWLPLEINGSFEFTFDTLMEQFAIWQEFVTSQFSYTYFKFEHKYITIKANIKYNFDTTNAVQFDKSFAHNDRIVSPYSFTINTSIPKLDKNSKYSNINEFFNSIEHNLVLKNSRKNLNE